MGNVDHLPGNLFSVPIQLAMEGSSAIVVFESSMILKMRPPADVFSEEI